MNKEERMDLITNRISGDLCCVMAEIELNMDQHPDTWMLWDDLKETLCQASEIMAAINERENIQKFHQPVDVKFKEWFLNSVHWKYKDCTDQIQLEPIKQTKKAIQFHLILVNQDKEETTWIPKSAIDNVNDVIDYMESSSQSNDLGDYKSLDYDYVKCSDPANQEKVR